MQVMSLSVEPTLVSYREFTADFLALLRRASESQPGASLGAARRPSMQRRV
jgi:hypothetical protein